MNYYNDNKQALNDLISVLENGNGISIMAKEDVESELNYTSKCHSIEEEIGCPLEVYVKLHQQMKFYRLNALNEIIECEIDNPNDYEVYHIQANGIFFNQCDYGWQFYSFKDYKKTWWLKKDKSE